MGLYINNINTSTLYLTRPLRGFYTGKTTADVVTIGAAAI
jgi:hypothetical protein